ncbi:hypothetical protein CAL7716_085670 [Calothrix sp. PCC 7716]|nr:hypothetical protein CAL7716_085670 [Calothrix sp. PCC 7716]
MKNIEFPDHWTLPKYKLGQHVKQGQIVGVEYHPPGTRRSYTFGEGWHYWILIHELEEDIENLPESYIKPLTPEELRSVVSEQQALIEAYQKNIAALTKQAEED